VRTRRLTALRPGDADLVEDFTDPTLDPQRWVDHYLPHWTTPDRSRARYALTGQGLQLRIEPDQLDWRPEDAPLRVSNLQTATFSGPVGSTVGTHRHRPDGLVVRTATPPRLLWAPRAGQVDVTVTASVDRGCMLAVWLVGTEADDPRDSGEVCVFEIDADAVGGASTRARVGVKAHADPRLRTDMTEVDVAVRAGQAHTWSARWGPDGVVIACEQQVVHASRQGMGYPVQLMIDLFEIGPRDDAGSYPKIAMVHAVRGASRGVSAGR
jgi:hypothetical protein